MEYKENDWKDTPIIIPSLDPDEKLPQVVAAVIDIGFNRVILVDDGSSKENKKIFNDIIHKYDKCILLEHSINLGKGRALKTAFNYCLINYKDSCNGVITVDGDNQHHIDDIVNIAKELSESNDSLILGARDFDHDTVPFRSSFGNKLTRVTLKALCGINVTDTQTGLRAIPIKYLSTFLDMEGERFEFETNMLIKAKNNNINIKEIKIKTVYIEENKTSHFNPFKDSIKIYILILKFTSASFLSSIADLLLFTLVYSLLKTLDLDVRILLSTVLARISSSIINFLMNKNMVFEHKEDNKPAVARYYTLCITQMLLSYGGVYLGTMLIKAYPTFVKIIVDFILFMLSFQIQREWVFKKRTSFEKAEDI
jgi:dolichol-phosphate mannosyltransferase